MKDSKTCYTCQKQVYSVLSASCGHKICFNCVKSNKNSHKCSACSVSQQKNRHFLSPSRNASHQPKQKSTKVKDSQSRTVHEFSPSFSKINPTIQRSSLGNYSQSPDHLGSTNLSINCKQHHQPLSMYSKSTKELICSVCLCNRTRYGDVLPLKSSEDYLRKENRLNKEECKIIQSNIENANRIITKNSQIFKQTFENALQSVQQLFTNIRKETQILQNSIKQQISLAMQSKLKQCRQIESDLDYLSQILKDFRQSNKQLCPFNELIYLFSSFKVIKNTVKNLDLQYLPYLKQPQIIQVSKRSGKQIFKDLVKLKLDLPLKLVDRRKKTKSQSNKSVSRSKNEEWDEVQKGGYTGKMGKQHRGSMNKKHQMSLCNQIHGIQASQDEKNLYKVLLKTKFKL